MPQQCSATPVLNMQRFLKKENCGKRKNIILMMICIAYIAYVIFIAVKIKLIHCYLNFIKRQNEFYWFFEVEIESLSFGPD